MDIINKKNLVFYDKDWNSSNLTNERNLLLTIYGKVSCGKLKFIDDNVEGFVEIPSSFLGEDKYFVLKSDGDSMINAGIKKGDLLDGKIKAVEKYGLFIATNSGDGLLHVSDIFDFYWDQTEIFDYFKKGQMVTVTVRNINSKNQISFINISDNKEIGVERYKYKKCKITDVYMELMEEIFCENDN